MRTEKIISIFAIIGLLFKYMHWPGGNFLLVLSLSIMSIVYFPLSFYFFSANKKINGHPILFSLIAGMFLSSGILGIEFKLLYWPGSGVMLLTGIVGVIFVSIVSGIKLAGFNKEELNVSEGVEVDENVIDDELIKIESLKYNPIKYYQRMLIRSSIIGGVSIILYFTSRDTMLELQYGNHPKLIELKKRCFDGDDSACEEMQEYSYQLDKENNY